MGKHPQDRAVDDGAQALGEQALGEQALGAQVDVSRRSFLAKGAAGVGAAAIAGAGVQDAAAQNGAVRWDFTADVVIVGAGVAGLPAAITARDLGASVIVVDENFDIGGRGMLSGGRIQLGGGHALQQKLGIKDTPEQVFKDWVRFDHEESKFSDRDLIRVFADEQIATWDFLIENGVEYIEKPINSPDASTVARIFVMQGMARRERDHTRRGETATAPASSGGSSRARARRARKFSSSTR